MTPGEIIAAAVEAVCDVDQVVPVRPLRLSGRMAYVEPADPWKERDERYCGFLTGLDVYLVAGSTDPLEAVKWLDEQSALILAINKIVIDDDEIQATRVGRPFLLVQDGVTSSFIACKVEFDRFITGD